ncbi:hypothetical protein [uncultured Campylobacter sp.]|uniref:hypothetical protein n=1 Tax=uncultured Campylobacter sp. TaxID=218934 RepID=UPI002630D5DC|nr:hypothetical protein [uncultured Campylobacter sp.]
MGERVGEQAHRRESRRANQMQAGAQAARLNLKYCAARYFANTNRLMTLAKSRLCGQILDRANL